MSSALYATRVYFDGERGCIKVEARNGLLGIETHISQPPVIPGLPKLEEIDYGGLAYPAELRPWMGERREMSGDELRAIRQWLAEYVGADI
jgi:hypothetical protein